MTRQATMSEENLQIHVVKLLEAYGRPDIEWHHVPNGADRHPAVAAKLKLAGVKRGVADLKFVIEGQPIAVELKTEIGTLSADQLDWRKTFERAGGKYFVAFGLQEAIGVLKGIKAFRQNINITLSPTIADDGRGARRRPWEAQIKPTKAANAAPKPSSPVKPRRAADPVSPNT